MGNTLAHRSQPPWKAKLAELFGIDPRTLALFRIGLGVLLLVDLAVRALDLTAFYTDEGIFPVDAICSYFGKSGRWSLHLLDGSAAYQATLMGIAAVAALMLLVGYRTWLATVVSWFLLVSLHTRSPLINNGGDTLFRMLLFWSMFLPLGRRWSLDARRHPLPPQEQNKPVFSIATFALLMQMVIMYVFTGMFKFNEVWLAGEGLEDALLLRCYGRATGLWLLQFPWLLTLLTYWTHWLELLGPLLFFCPWKTPYVRTFMVLNFVGLHAGIELCMTVGLFSYVSFVGLIAFLPGAIWPRRNTAADSPTEPEDQPTPRSRQLGFADLLPQGVCLLCFLFVFYWNIATLQDDDSFKRVMPRRLARVGQAMMIWQNWSMFIRPPTTDYWYVAEARLKDGSMIDILRNSPPPGENPPHPSRTFPNHRWRKYFDNLEDKDIANFRQPTGEYLARAWNAHHSEDKQILSLELKYFYYNTHREPDSHEFAEERFSWVELRPPNERGPFAEEMRKLKKTEQEKKNNP